MKQVCKSSCQIKFRFEVDKQLAQAHFCLFLPDSASNRKIFITNTFNQSIDIYHACRVSCYHCSAAVACRWNIDPCYNHLKKVVEWSINDLETSQEPCWSNWILNQWTSFEVVAQRSSCWLGNSLNMPKPLNLILQESFKNKIGRNSVVLGHFRCS